MRKLSSAKMKKYRALIFMIFFCNFGFAKKNQQTPDDVNVFIEYADMCTHFAGEWDSNLSKERKKEITEGIDKYCVLAKDQQKKLMIKYNGNKQIENELSAYDLY